MSYYGYDMDHDGEITGKDTAMFHEMLAEDEKSSESDFPFLCTNGYSRKEFWTLPRKHMQPVKKHSA